MAQDSDKATIAHISDVHLPTPGKLPLRDLLNKRFLSLLSWKLSRQYRHLPEISSRIVADMARHRPDRILNIGDITNLGHKSEFEQAEKWMRALPAPCYFVPGNHDILVRADVHEGLDLMSPWMEGSAQQFPYVTTYHDVAIIGVNSAIPTPPFKAWGRVGEAQGQRLLNALETTRGLFRIVMIHHPPGYGLVKSGKRLKDVRKIAEIIKQGGAELVLHGHSHNESLVTVPETEIPLLGVSSTSMHSIKPWRRASWNRLEICKKEGFWSLGITQRLLGDDHVMQDGFTRHLKLPMKSK